MLDHPRPQVGDILVGDVEPGVAEPIDGLAEQPGVEGGHTVDDQAEAQGLGGLVGELAVTDVAVVIKVSLCAYRSIAVTVCPRQQEAMPGVGQPTQLIGTHPRATPFFARGANIQFLENAEERQND